ncbi:MAG: hypothetical protein K2H98_03265 [Duncaniella sp.]|nr:hypothetical protein [Duncaniella sp.]
MTRYFLLLLIAVTAFSATADDTTRRGLKRRPQTAVTVVRAEADSIPALGGEILISGYDKPLDSRRETFHVTSSMPDTITGLTLRLVYSDVTGRRLHEVTHRVDCMIPPYDTRMVSIPSFDRQCRYFYARGRQSRASGVTPFEVTIHPVTIFLIHDS